MPRQTLDTIEKQIRQADAEAGQSKARLDQLRARKAVELRKARTQRCVLAGAVVIKRAETDSEFAALLWKVLDQELTTARTRKLFGLPDKD